MPRAANYTAEMARTFLQRNSARPGNPPVPEAFYLVWDCHRRLLGICGLHARLGPGALEIGYWVDVRRTRQGITTLAAAALSELALATQGCRRSRSTTTGPTRQAAGSLPGSAASWSPRSPMNQKRSRR